MYKLYRYVKIYITNVDIKGSVLMEMLEIEKVRNRYAWKICRYFARNNFLLEDAENYRMYKNAKDILVKYYSSENEGDISCAVDMLADIQIEYMREDFVPDREIFDFLFQ